MRILDVLLRRARPEFPRAREQIHAVVHGLGRRVKLRPPEAQDIVRLVDERAAVERAERRRIADVQNEHPARTHKQVQPVQHLRQLLRRQVVDPVERAVGRVDRAVEIELRRLLAQQQRLHRVRGQIGIVRLRLHEHIGRAVGCDHLIPARGHQARERAGAAAKIQQGMALAAPLLETLLIKVRERGIIHIAGQRIVPCGKGAVSAHACSSGAFSACSLSRPNTISYPPVPYCRLRLTRLIVALEAPVFSRMSL